MPVERFQLGGGEVVVGADADDCARLAAEHFAALAQREATGERPFQVALAGGTTMRSLWQRLAQAPFADSIPWEWLHFFWVDESNVPPGHPQSNFSAARDLLLSHVAVPAIHQHRIPTGGGTAIEAADFYQRTLRENLPLKNDLPRLDYVWLGLGQDGSTASLFAHTPLLHERQRLVAAEHIEEVCCWRITLTVPMLNNAAQIVFLVTGEEKASAVAHVLQGAREPENYPAQLIAPNDGTTTWILDSLAARLLERPR